MKKAFLVTANVTTRVVIDMPDDGVLDEATFDKLVDKAKSRLNDNLSNDYYDCVEDVREDTDMPYEPNND
jgi:hypothetical protein